MERETLVAAATTPGRYATQKHTPAHHTPEGISLCPLLILQTATPRLLPGAPRSEILTQIGMIEFPSDGCSAPYPWGVTGTISATFIPCASVTVCEPSTPNCGTGEKVSKNGASGLGPAHVIRACCSLC